MTTGPNDADRQVPFLPFSRQRQKGRGYRLFHDVHVCSHAACVGLATGDINLCATGSFTYSSMPGRYSYHRRPWTFCASSFILTRPSASQSRARGPIRGSKAEVVAQTDEKMWAGSGGTRRESEREVAGFDGALLAILAFKFRSLKLSFC